MLLQWDNPGERHLIQVKTVPQQQGWVGEADYNEGQPPDYKLFAVAFVAPGTDLQNSQIVIACSARKRRYSVTELEETPPLM